MPESLLEKSVTELEGIGPTRAEQLAKADVHTVGDLLHYFPRDYQYVSSEAPISDLAPNTVATARGEVTAVDYIAGSRPRFEATLDDGTGKLALTFFNSAYLRHKIHPGIRLRVKGKLRFFRNMPQMQNPKWWIIYDEEGLPSDGGEGSEEKPKASFMPVYPASGKLTSDVFIKLIDQILPAAVEAVPETLPAGILGRRELLGRREAYRLIHRPESKSDAIEARKRLVYDELFVMQLGLLLSRNRHTGRLTAPLLKCDKLLDQRIRARFPFSMTHAQLTATYEILKDMASGQAMNRLLQGDVGSGKTAVATYAMLVAVANKMQAALLAPTEVLAEQHYLTLSRFLATSSVAVELFTSRTKKASRGGLTRALSDGRVHIAVGTQALLQQDIDFANLGLVVVDEQHRLGVQQRATLRGKGLAPHYLVMTATPIPRTLALSYFADFDLSVIDELPPGRTPIVTQLLVGKEQDRAWPQVRSEVSAGRQAYMVVPKIGDGIDDDEGLGDDKASLLKEYRRLSEGPLKGLRVVMLHGQMPPEEKQAVMESFRIGEADVLLATTVIEVGVDVPNATVMVIMDADRFGLSQLHQLRGRVGRGQHESICLLLTTDATDNAMARLQPMTQTTSGFDIAELDLRLRGPGQFFGTRQHGLPEFRLADLSQETDLLHHAREDAQWLLSRDPKLLAPELVELRREIQRDFGEVLPLATVG